MVDLDALSREVAAAGDEWITAGVEVIWDGTPLRLCVIDRPGEPGMLHGMNRWGGAVRWQKGADMRPNLRDPVTVNALLGEGEVVNYWADGRSWTVNHGEEDYPTRTEAICRAWIAARGKDNG